MRLSALLLLCLAVGCGAPSSPVTASSSAPGVRVLVFSRTDGFRHDSIPAAREALTALAARTGAFTVTASEDVADLSAARLANVDVVMFAMTTGELPLDADT